MKIFQLLKFVLTGSISLPVTLAINVLIGAFTVCIFGILPYGTEVRQMGWALLIFEVAGVTFILGSFLSMVDIAREKTQAAVASFVFTLTPLPFALTLFKFITAIRGLHVLS